MARPAIRLLSAVVEPLSHQLPIGRLVELSGPPMSNGARTTTAVSILRHAQAQGETAAWIQPRHGPLFPPDLHEAGIDLAALVVVHVPPDAGTHGACKAAETLLRSGAFGLLVIDLCEGVPAGSGETWQARLLGLARQHRTQVLLLTEKPAVADSLGSLVGLRIEARRTRIPGTSQIAIEPLVLKNKLGERIVAASETYVLPWGWEGTSAGPADTCASYDHVDDDEPSLPLAAGAEW